VSKFYFNPNIAKQYGVNEAIVLEYIFFWQSRGKKKRDGRYWTYGSVSTITKHFPFWSNKQVWRILKSLEEKEAILVGSFNKKGYDRTKWYSVNEEVFSQMVKPIPVVNNNNNNNFNIPKHQPL